MINQVDENFFELGTMTPYFLVDLDSFSWNN